MLFQGNMSNFKGKQTVEEEKCSVKNENRKISEEINQLEDSE